MTSKITFVLLAFMLVLSLVMFSEMSLQECQSEQDRIRTQYKSALDNCAHNSGYAKAACVQEVRAALPAPTRISSCSSGRLSLLSFR